MRVVSQVATEECRGHKGDEFKISKLGVPGQTNMAYSEPTKRNYVLAYMYYMFAIRDGNPREWRIRMTKTRLFGQRVCCLVPLDNHVTWYPEEVYEKLFRF